MTKWVCNEFWHGACFYFAILMITYTNAVEGIPMNPPLHSEVHFCVGDIVHPYPVQVLCQLYENKSLRGEIIAITNDGCQPGNYVVVRVQGLDEPIIVPIGKTSPEPPKIPRTSGSPALTTNNELNLANQ